jgi:hypothetical protein
LSLSLLIVLFGISKSERPCESGQFAMMHYGNYTCRPCSKVYKNCNSCDPKNLDQGNTFCSSCKFFYNAMGFESEKKA